jgi:thiol-disulfide isomerase/thioredoxin
MSGMGLLARTILLFFSISFLFSCNGRGNSDRTDTGWNNGSSSGSDRVPSGKSHADTVWVKGGCFPAHQPFDTSSFRQARATVFFFLSPDCPLCQNYGPLLAGLPRQYDKDSIRFYGVFPGTLYSDKEISAFFDTYKIPFCPVVDEQKTLTALLNATVTPEAVIVDGKGHTVYSGRIDNWAYELGRKRTVVTEHELQDALAALVKGEPVKVKHADAVGCIIETGPGK